MAIKVKQIWVDENGKRVPKSDNLLYDTSCECCGDKPSCGVTRHNNLFMCLGCLDERLGFRDEE